MVRARHACATALAPPLRAGWLVLSPPPLRMLRRHQGAAQPRDRRVRGWRPARAGEAPRDARAAQGTARERGGARGGRRWRRDRRSRPVAHRVQHGRPLLPAQAVRQVPRAARGYVFQHRAYRRVPGVQALLPAARRVPAAEAGGARGQRARLPREVVRRAHHARQRRQTAEWRRGGRGRRRSARGGGRRRGVGGARERGRLAE